MNITSVLGLCQLKIISANKISSGKSKKTIAWGWRTVANPGKEE
jgi:hypothetical protein